MVRLGYRLCWAYVSCLSVPPSINAFSRSSKLLLYCARGNLLTRTSRMDLSSSLGQADIGRQSLPCQREASSASNVDYLPDGSSWRKLLERSSALARPIRGSNYVQLATVDGDGLPRCRTVVFRGFLPHHPDLRLVWDEGSIACDNLPCILAMTTDARSRKVEQAARLESGAAELVWWFPNSNEQYRIAGEIAFVGAHEDPGLGNGGDGANARESLPLSRNQYLQQERLRMWGRLTEAARESFRTDAIPGHVYTPLSDRMSSVAVGASDSVQSSDDPPESFLLMLLVPHSVDYLRLTNMYRQTDRIEGGEWTNERVNP